MGESSSDTPESGLGVLAREVEQFVASGGWDQPVQLFALVPTAELLQQQPELREQLDTSAPLTPVAQEALPQGELDEALAKIVWPETVRGCAIVQEIVALPPDAEDQLPDGADEGDAARLREAAASHPMRTEARLVAAVLRDGTAACVMRLRGHDTTAEATEATGEEIIERADLAPNLVNALRTTLTP